MDGQLKECIDECGWKGRGEEGRRVVAFMSPWWGFQLGLLVMHDAFQDEFDGAYVVHIGSILPTQDCFQARK